LNARPALALIAIAALSTSTDAAAPRAVAVECEPALPVFCQNIHVGCAGPTDLRTFSFKLRVAAGRAWIEAGPEAADFQRQYSDAHVEWGDADAYVLLLPRGRSGYIKLMADGSFSFRHYPDDTGVMSYGRCQ
jgi:hypothetical protein